LITRYDFNRRNKRTFLNIPENTAYFLLILHDNNRFNGIFMLKRLFGHRVMKAAFPKSVARAPYAVVCFSVLTACAQTGDFDRPINGENIAGFLAAKLRLEAVSVHALTEEEQALRSRAWRLLMPEPDTAWLRWQLSQLAQQGFVPKSMGLLPPDSVYNRLAGMSYTSPVARYRRLGHDARADQQLLPPFREQAVRVLEIDRMRQHATRWALTPSTLHKNEADLRVLENRCLIAWVDASMDARAAAYQYALEHLITASPEREAVAVERVLTGLQKERLLLKALREQYGIGTLEDPSCLSEAVPAHLVETPEDNGMEHPRVTKD
jgi:hypothetical protein